MSQNYHIKSVKRLDTWRSKYAQGEDDDMIDYFLNLEEVDGPIKLTQKVRTPVPEVGSIMYGSLEEKTGKKGTYYKFKKENPEYKGGGGKSNYKPKDEKQIAWLACLKVSAQLLAVKYPNGSGNVNLIETVVQGADELVRHIPVSDTQNTEKPSSGAENSSDEAIEDIDPDEPVDLSNIPF